MLVLRAAVLVATASAAINMQPWPLNYRRLMASANGSDLIGDACDDKTPCGGGSVCIAGSADKAVQACAQSPGCSGNIAGFCPGLRSIGSLVCAWSPVLPSQCSDHANSCIAFNGQSGIYKCMSLDRCDAATSGTACSEGCKATNGLICNGRGGCQTTDGAKYTCTCNEGWDGPQCEKVVSDSCKSNIGNCGGFGTCVNGTCSCESGYTGKQCEVPANSTTTPVPTTGAATTAAPGSTTSTPKTPSSSADGTSSGTGGGTTSGKDGSSSNNWWWIVLLIAAALALSLLVAMVVRKKMRQREEDRQNADARQLMEESVEDGGAQTPKGMIQTL